MRFLFWGSWGSAAIVAGIAVLFFFAGLADGSVSSSNIVLWVTLLCVAASVTGGSLWLKRTGRPVLATIVAMLLAAPGLLAAVMLLIVLISHPRWN